MRAAILFLIGLCFWQNAGAQEGPYVVMVSFDGFRHDYVEKYNAVHFKEFIKKGSKAKGLIPSFPSKTFPNHYSLVTGLYPAHHGLVDNHFYDPATGIHFSAKNKKAVGDSVYHSGTPLWRLVQQSGRKSASYFWVGSEVLDRHPDYYYPYDEQVPNAARVSEVLRWLQLPKAERPTFIALYFSTTDDQGHQYGPESEQVRMAVLQMDSLLGQLMDGIEKIRLPVNVVLVSDHGMKGIEQRESSYILLPELLKDLNKHTVIANSGSHVHIYQPDRSVRDSLYLTLRENARHFRVLKQNEFPPHWHYQSKRVGDILLVAEPGYYFLNLERSQLGAFLKPWGWAGTHGYDPRGLEEMNGIFYAAGPNIREGYTLEAFENIHVYPLVARILGLVPPAIDGKADVLNVLYRSTDARKKR